MTISYRFWFVLSSFLPLFVILTVKFGFAKVPVPVLFWSAFVLVGLSVLGTDIILSNLKGSEAKPLTFDKIKSKDNDVFSYLLAYIPVIVMDDYTQAEIGLPLLVLYAALFILFVRIDIAYVNPVLALLGYRVFEAETEEGKDGKAGVIILSREEYLSGKESLSVHEVANGRFYFLPKKPKEQDTPPVA